MLFFALFFAVLAVLGALVGLRERGQPIGAHAIAPYGWVLCIDAGAICALLAHTRFCRSGHSRS